MMRIALALLVLVLAPAAHAAKTEPLLSGYGGPGDGEQALLGQTLLLDGAGGRGGGGGGTAGATSASPPPSPDAIYEAIPDPTPAAAPGAVPPPARPGRRPSRRPSSANRKPGKPQAPAPARRPAADPPALAVGTGGEALSAPAPFAGRDLLLLAAVLLGALALAGCARRLAVRAARGRRPVVLQLP